MSLKYHSLGLCLFDMGVNEPDYTCDSVPKPFNNHFQYINLLIVAIHQQLHQHIFFFQITHEKFEQN